MKIIRKDGEDYIRWRPKVSDIGVHPVTVIFTGVKTTEKDITVYVYNKKLLDEQRENQPDAD